MFADVSWARICVYETGLYTWRDTEPVRRTSREHYPEAFRMRKKDIDEAPQVPTIPPML
ncbi:non-oxidative hydroxyarylic acid decarboxylases subunit D [Enterobacter intestinihominis]